MGPGEETLHSFRERLRTGEIYRKGSKIGGGFMMAAVLFRERKAASQAGRQLRERRLLPQNAEGVGLQVFLAPGCELAGQLDNVFACRN